MQTPIDVLKEQMGFPEDFDMKTGALHFSIVQGYVRFFCRNKPEHGSIESNYSYHPNGSCEGKGICIHCGSTLFNY